MAEALTSVGRAIRFVLLICVTREQSEKLLNMSHVVHSVVKVGRGQD